MWVKVGDYQVESRDFVNLNTAGNDVLISPFNHTVSNNYLYHYNGKNLVKLDNVSQYSSLSNITAMFNESNNLDIVSNDVGKLYKVFYNDSGNIESLTEIINSININQSFNIIDKNYNNYIFKSYIVTHNILRIYHGVCGLVFSSNY